MGLFDLFKNKKHSVGNLDHLTPEGNLPYGWLYANRKFTQKIDTEYQTFSDAVIEAKKNGVREEYFALGSLVQYMEDVRKLCDSMGECFSEWASVKVANPIVYQQEKERLQYMEANLPELLKQEAMIKNLRKDLLQIVTDNPGILQTDVYKRFSPDLKNTVSNELYQLWSQEKISREKQGRTYSLHRTK